MPALKSLFFAIIGLISWMLTSCASGPPVSEAAKSAANSFTPPKGKSLIYIYRPYKFIGAALPGRVWINQQLVGETRNGTFMAIPVKPGRYSILGSGPFAANLERIIKSEPAINLVAKPDEIYLFRQSVSIGNPSTFMLQTGGTPIPVGSSEFYFYAMPVNQFTGRTELQTLRQVGTKFEF